KLQRRIAMLAAERLLDNRRQRHRERGHRCRGQDKVDGRAVRSGDHHADVGAVGRNLPACECGARDLSHADSDGSDIATQLYRSPHSTPAPVKPNTLVAMAKGRGAPCPCHADPDMFNWLYRRAARTGDCDACTTPMLPCAVAADCAR